MTVVHIVGEYKFFLIMADLNRIHKRDLSRDTGKKEFETGEMLDLRDTEQAGCRTGGMQDWWDAHAGLVGCRTGGMHKMRDPVQEGCSTRRGIQKRRDAGN